MGVDVDPAVQIQNQIRDLKRECATQRRRPARQDAVEPHAIGHAVVIVVDRPRSRCARGVGRPDVCAAVESGWGGIYERYFCQPLVLIVVAVVRLWRKLPAIDRDITRLLRQDRRTVGWHVCQMAGKRAGISSGSQNPIARSIAVANRGL